MKERKRKVRLRGDREEQLLSTCHSEGGLWGLQGARWGLKVGAMGALLCLVSGYVWGTEADPGTEGEPLMKTGVGTLHPGLPGDLQGENLLPEP